MCPSPLPWRIDSQMKSHAMNGRQTFTALLLLHTVAVSTVTAGASATTQPAHPIAADLRIRLFRMRSVYPRVHATKVERNIEGIASVVSNSFSAVAKLSDGLYTSLKCMNNCRGAPTRTRLSSCIYVANLMQLRRCEWRYVACDPPRNRFRENFPNQQPRRGLV